MRYKIHHELDVFEQNPGLLAVEKFAKLTSNQMKFVILVCDESYDNPVRTLPERERRQRAAIFAGYKLEPDGKRPDKNARDIADGKVPRVEDAIITYRGNHYDEKLDSISALDKQITEIREFLKSDKKSDAKALDMSIKLGTKLPDLIEAKKKTEELLGINFNHKPELGPTYTTNDLPDSTEEGSEPMSTIDQFMQSRR